MALLAGATIGAGVLGAGSSLVGGGKASSAAKSAANLQKQQLQQQQTNIGPYVSAGRDVLPSLTALVTGSPTGGGPNYIGMAQGNMPGTFTEAQLEATPGYQFIKDQGLKSVQAANAAKGLGVSGAALKGAGQYVTGLADQTYQQMFNMQQQNFANYLNLNAAQQGNLQNQYGRLAGVAGMGAGAAANQAQAGVSAANAAGNYLTQSGTLAGTGTINATNALTGSLQNLLGYNQFQNMMSVNNLLGANPGATLGYANPSQGPGAVINAGGYNPGAYAASSGL